MNNVIDKATYAKDWKYLESRQRFEIQDNAYIIYRWTTIWINVVFSSENLQLRK